MKDDEGLEDGNDLDGGGGVEDGNDLDGGGGLEDGNDLDGGGGLEDDNDLDAGRAMSMLSTLNLVDDCGDSCSLVTAQLQPQY